MSDRTTDSNTASFPETINYTCRIRGTATTFQPVNYQPRPGYGTGIAGMVYVARPEAHSRGICFACLNGKRRLRQQIILLLDSEG